MLASSSGHVVGGADNPIRLIAVTIPFRQKSLHDLVGNTSGVPLLVDRNAFTFVQKDEGPVGAGRGSRSSRHAARLLRDGPCFSLE